jgi:hypothetical protein
MLKIGIIQRCAVISSTRVHQSLSSKIPTELAEWEKCSMTFNAEKLTAGAFDLIPVDKIGKTFSFQCSLNIKNMKLNLPYYIRMRSTN